MAVVPTGIGNTTLQFPAFGDPLPSFSPLDLIVLFRDVTKNFTCVEGKSTFDGGSMVIHLSTRGEHFGRQNWFPTIERQPDREDSRY